MYVNGTVKIIVGVYLESVRTFTPIGVGFKNV